MYRIILSLLISGLITNAFADYAVQTDWSGGGGIYGPVSEWSNEYLVDSNIGYSSPFNLTLGKTLAVIPLKHTIDDYFLDATSVYAEDVNGDGYTDVLGAARIADEITWWENVDGSGTSWTEHTVDGDFDGAYSVFSADVNGDGYMDVLGAAELADEITWWENVDGSGTSWTEHTVDGDFIWASSVHAADVDGDGYTDVLGAARIADEITWWENVDGSGTSWTEHTVDGDFNGAVSVYSADVNGDGFMDVIGAAHGAGEIAWWENVDGSGTNWTEHTVDGDFIYASSVHAADVDGDGYIDVLGASDNEDDIAWWENMDGSGTSWIQHTVDGDFNGAVSVYSADVSGDGYMDVIGAAYGDDDITWWENSDTSPGIIWIEHTVDGDFNEANSVYSTDVNGDGYMDVLGASWDDITWWDVTGDYLPEGSLESSCLYLQNDPGWSTIDWTAEEPAGTSVSFQVRSCDSPDSTGMGAWSDTLHTPCSLFGLLTEGDSFFQYKAILQTSDTTLTPTLEDVTVTWNPVRIGETAEPIPQESELFSIKPNPSAESPIIRFWLPEQACVGICIFDLSGRLVNEIQGDDYTPGYHDVSLGDLSSGIYFCRMVSGDYTATQKFVVIQ